MCLCLVCCVAVLAINTHFVFGDRLVGLYNIQDDTGIFSTDKRAAFTPAYLGMQAWTKLLTGTRRVWSKTPNTRVHIKMGDATTALKEFKSLRPKHVHDFKNPDGATGVKGEVGDRTVVLKDKGDSFPATPTIEIYKTERDDVVSVVDKVRFMTGFADLL